MKATDDDSRFARLFLIGLFFVTVISALPHLFAEDRRAGTFLTRTAQTETSTVNEKRLEREDQRGQLLPPGPSAEEIHDFLYAPNPPTREDNTH